MKKQLKLITEESYDFEIIESKTKRMYIIGKYSSAEQKNANGRIYSKQILDREVSKLMEGSIKNKTCIGQLGHPVESPETDLEKAAILMEDLSWKGNDLFGKALVLDTPSGDIVRSLIKDVKIGISSRGLGTVSESGYVNEDFSLIVWDLVQQPSCPGAYVNGILESKFFTVEDTDLKSPSENEVKEFLKEHEKKIWQVLKSFKKGK